MEQMASIEDADEDVTLEVTVLVLEASSPCMYSARVAAIGLDLVGCLLFQLLLSGSCGLSVESCCSTGRVSSFCTG